MEKGTSWLERIPMAGEQRGEELRMACNTLKACWLGGGGGRGLKGGGMATRERSVKIRPAASMPTLILSLNINKS